MSKKAIIVENLAWLYADVIQGVMMGGLEDMTGGFDNSTGQHPSLDRAMSDGVRSQQLLLTSSDSSSCTTTAVSTKVGSQIRRPGVAVGSRLLMSRR